VCLTELAQLRIVHMSIRATHNPQSDVLRRSRYVLRRDTKEIYSVDKYVWPVLQEFHDVPSFFAFKTSAGLIPVCVCVAPSESGIVKWVSDYGAFPQDSAFDLMGFDVADAALISGLLDCEYSDMELDQLSVTWKSKLNEYHLIDGEAEAVAFRHLCNGRVPEHAPFLVYQLWSKRAVS